MEEVGSLDLAVSDTRLEDECMVGRVVRADLAHVAEVLEDLRHGAEERCDRLTALVGLEHDGAAEDDVI
jgi:hypothetical protein